MIVSLIDCCDIAMLGNKIYFFSLCSLCSLSLRGPPGGHSSTNTICIPWDYGAMPCYWLWSFWFVDLLLVIPSIHPSIHPFSVCSLAQFFVFFLSFSIILSNCFLPPLHLFLFFFSFSLFLFLSLFFFFFCVGGKKKKTTSLLFHFFTFFIFISLKIVSKY